jgi:hypothetical protein
VRKKARLAPVAGLILFAAAAVLVVGTYTFLPPLVESMVARSVQEGLGLEARPRVELRGASAPERLAGRFSGGRISLGAADLGGVRVERVAVDLDPFDLDLLASLLGGAIESDEPLSGTLRLEATEEEVSRLAKAEADVPLRDVELEEGRELVRSEIPAFGIDVPVSVQGGLALQGGELVFEPQRVSVFGMPVPERLAEQVLAGADFAYALGGLPYGAEITGVEVAENRLVLSGELERVPISGG